MCPVVIWLALLTAAPVAAETPPAPPEPAPVLVQAPAEKQAPTEKNGVSSEGEQPPPAAEATPAPETTPATNPPAAERWWLMRTLQGTWPGWLLDDHRLSISGWTDASFTASSARDSNLPMGLNYRANDFLLQQNWLRLERTVVTSGTTEPTWGFRIDTILPGSDYRFTLSRGLFTDQLTADNGQPNLYGVDPVQFYVEAYFPTVAQGMDVKVGRFFAIYGVETLDAPSNALLSHCYTFFYDPFTHTGLLTTTQLTPAWSVQAGLVLGSDIFIDPADEPTFIGGLKWTAPDQRNWVQASVIAGSGRFNQARAFHNPEVLDLIWAHKISSRLNYTVEGLLGYTTHVTDLGTAWWAGNIHYLTWTLTPRLSSTLRCEFFDDFQGQRTGFPGLYTALTGGVAIQVRKAVLLRPEVRYDYNEESRPFEGRHGLFTAAMDVLVRW
jgi:hypothetical protein